MNTADNDNDNNISIKKDIITMLTEAMKFALVGMVVFLIIGTSVAYILLYIVGTSVEVAGILAGITTAILIVIIDYKKMHTTDKMTECNKRIVKKALKHWQ